MFCLIHIAFHVDKQTLIIINSTRFHEITINALKQFISKIELSLQYIFRMQHFAIAIEYTCTTISEYL